jgi:hypothetical protein
MNKFFTAGTFCLVAAMILSYPGDCNASNPRSGFTFSRGMELIGWEVFVCNSTAGPDTGCFTSMIWPEGDVPYSAGYPLRSAVFTGLNDTIQFAIHVYNARVADYSLIGKTPAAWYVPQIYRPLMWAGKGIPVVAASELHFRLRHWAKPGLFKVPSPTGIPKYSAGGPEYAMVIDVWGLPEGIWAMCLEPTSSVPSDFKANYGSAEYKMYPAQDGADSINAYVACFWRSIGDSNIVAAKDWVQKMLDVNPKSVPAWYLRGLYYHSYAKDSTAAKEAYDQALAYLYSSADPYWPTETQRKANPDLAEFQYYLRTKIEDSRAMFGP